MKRKSAEDPWESILDLKDPDNMFDLTCAGIYVAGYIGDPMPVDESRKVFAKIKAILIAKQKGRRK